MIQKRASTFHINEHVIIAILLSFILHAILLFVPVHSIEKQPKFASNLTVRLQPSNNQSSVTENNLSAEQIDASKSTDLTNLMTRLQKIEDIMYATKNLPLAHTQEQNQSADQQSASVESNLIPIEYVEYKPTLLYRPSLRYPPTANGAEGKVMIAASIAANGLLTDIKVKQSSGYQILDNTARKSAVSWRFAPPPGGATVPVEIPFVFEACDKRFL